MTKKRAPFENYKERSEMDAFTERLLFEEGLYERFREAREDHRRWSERTWWGLLLTEFDEHDLRALEQTGLMNMGEILDLRRRGVLDRPTKSEKSA